MVEENSEKLEERTSFKVNGEVFTYPDEIEILKKGRDLKKLLKKFRSVSSNGTSFTIGKLGNTYIFGIFHGDDKKIIESLGLSKNIDLDKFVTSTKKKIGDSTIFFYGSFTSITEEHRNLLVSIIHFMKNRNKSTNPVGESTIVSKDIVSGILKNK